MTDKRKKEKERKTREMNQSGISKLKNNKKCIKKKEEKNMAKKAIRN